VGRTADVGVFLERLSCQTYRKFELIVVDQNADDRLKPLIACYADRFTILHCKSAVGLSRARNVGILRASGDVIAFPDDDCWYADDLLERVAELFAADCGLDGVTGCPVGRIYTRLAGASCIVTKWNVFYRAISFTIFLRAHLVRVVGTFDESLGLGADSGRIAGEETDYLVRALSHSFRILYCSSIGVFHQEPPVLYDDCFNRKLYRYNLAIGHVLRKYRYPFWYILWTWCRAGGGMFLSAISLNCAKTLYHYHVLKGRILGWLS